MPWVQFPLVTQIEYASVAPTVEHWFPKPSVGGSNPVGTAKHFKKITIMKTLLLTVILFFVNFFNSQVIKIKVSEVMDSYGYDTSVLNVINNDSLIYEHRKVNSFYDIDLTNNRFFIIKSNGVEVEGDIYFDVKDGIYIINFLVDGYTTGLVVNLNNEQVSWFSISEQSDLDSDILQTYIEICKFINFQILKSS